MIGCDLRSLTEENKKLLTNPILLRINQDEEARPPIFMGNDDSMVAFKYLSDGEYAIGMFNGWEKDLHIMFNFYEVGLMPSDNCAFQLTDAFTGEDLGIFRDFVHLPVAQGDARVFLAKPVLL